jgi:hypothetical protein
MFLMTGEMQTLHPKGTANVNTTPRWVWGTTDYECALCASSIQRKQAHSFVFRRFWP